MAAVVRTQDIDGEQAIDLGYRVLVASKSDPGAWYVVEDSRCTCPGFEHRGKCRHLAVAEAAQRVPCHRCGTPTRPSEFGRRELTLCGDCAMAITSLPD